MFYEPFTFLENIPPKHHAEERLNGLAFLDAQRDVAMMLVLHAKLYSPKLRDGIQYGCSCLILSVVQRIIR